MAIRKASIHYRHIEKKLRIEDETTLSDKIQRLFVTFCITPDDIADRNEVCKFLNEIIKPYYPEGQFWIFGSTANGFGIAGTFLDLLFLPHPGYSSKLLRCIPPFLDSKSSAPMPKEELKKLFDQVPVPEKVKNGTYPYANLPTLDEITQLAFIKKILLSHRPKIKYSMFAPHTLQVVEFATRDSFRKCFISIRSRLVLYSAQLLDLYGQIDERVRPLVMSICYWAKCVHLIKPFHLSAYAVQLLVIFFLQNTSPPILPSLSYLHKHSGGSDTVDGCEVSITKDLNKIPKTKNTMPLGQLFVQFFKYYWNFDFARNVVSPHIGRVYPIRELKKNPFFKEFEILAMCIQDPFKLKCNIASNIGLSLVPDFKRMLYVALSQLEGEDPKGLNNDDFKRVFRESHYNIAKTRLFLPPALCPNSSNYCPLATATHIDISADIIAALGDGPQVIDLWYKRAAAAILDILKNGLMLECEVTDGMTFVRTPASYIKGRKPTYVKEYHDFADNPEDISDKPAGGLELITAIQCIAYTRTWFGRKAPESVADDKEAAQIENEVVRQEYAITRGLKDQYTEYVKNKEPISFCCKVYKTNHKQLHDVVVVLSPITSDEKAFKAWRYFLYSYLIKVVPKVLLK